MLQPAPALYLYFERISYIFFSSSMQSITDFNSFASSVPQFDRYEENFRISSLTFLIL